jgi:hypothetical protein
MQRIAIEKHELFASAPLNFAVYAADHQRSDWQEVGKFGVDSEIAGGRFTQSFNISEPLTKRFVKFIKYEMLDYIGDEIYCVLTSFSVYGHGVHWVDAESDTEGHESDNENDPDEAGGPIEKVVKIIGGILGGSGTPANNKPGEEPDR